VRRDIGALAEREFDLAVIGGGIYGIFIAWDATLRGLSVALVERGDFVNATSANSFRIVHGGIRYLQHADITRVRESSLERRAFLRVAPHLVEPLPIIIPTYGRGMQGRGAIAAGFRLYDLLTFDRNRGIRDPSRRIPPGRLLPPEEVLDLFPGVDPRGLTGGGLFHDGQMYNPTRLGFAFLRSAVERGAEAANYVEAVGFLRDGDSVCGLKARDVLGGDTFDIRSRVVVNAAGPWAENVVGRGLGVPLDPPGTYSRDTCFIVRRKPRHRVALAVPGRTRDPDAIVSRKARHLFVAPWRDVTLVGVWHVVHRGDPDRFTVTRDDLEEFIGEINAAHPALALSAADVTMWNAGLVLFGENEPGARDLSYGKRSRIVDHSKTHGIQGLITAIGVRWTTARTVADRVVGLAVGKLGGKPTPSGTDATPAFGGDIDDMDDFLVRILGDPPAALAAATPEVLRRLCRNYGTAVDRIGRYAGETPSGALQLGGSDVLRAEVTHAVREEAAVRLGDVVFRRTDLGTAGDPGEEAISEACDMMADELGWSVDRRARELADVRRVFDNRAAPGVIEGAGAPIGDAP
jgi:glycerol-3-phosphate dehydrogenase